MSAPATSNPAHRGVNLELFKTVDWTDKDSICKLFPAYFQEQYSLEKQKINGVSKNVEIEDFRLKAPFATDFLLDYCLLKLEFGKRQVLYGENSTGKSLLMHQMANGEIKGFPKHIHVHHCKELEGEEELQHSVLDTILYCNPMRNNLIMCEEKLKEVIAAETDAEKLKILQQHLLFIQMNMNKIQGYDAQDRIIKMLRVLGFDEVGQARPVKDLSGGLRMRVALCMAFFIDSDLLLLDEPTNHLDFPSVLWLENRLRAYRGAFLMVSHDRELLNNVCTSVLLIEDKKIHYYPMGFKEFEKKKALEDKKKCEDIEKFLSKNRNADPSTMLGRQKFDKQKWQEAYYARQVALAGKFTFPPTQPLSNPQKLPEDQISLINLQNVRFSYKPETGHFIFNNPISFNVTTSTRCGVMGPNGAGKSTLLKLLTKKIFPTEGVVEQHPKFQLAYFGQHSTAELDLELTAIEFMQHSFPNEKAGILRNHLMKTGVGENIMDKRIKTLSYSQRSCIIFAKLTFIGPHLLILDEPTNFLDLPSVDSLIMACNKYPGALLLVSHNRDFLRKCAKQFLSVVPGKFQLFDNMRGAESATYTFIQEMEDGIKVGADILTKVPSGGSVHSTQVAGAAATVDSVTQGVANVSVSGAAASRPATAAAPAVKYEINEKIKAQWTDGKYYAAVVKKIQPDGKYLVTYTEYGNSVAIPVSKMQKVVAAPAAAGKPGAKGPAKK